jgi:hypothetical protein
VLGLLRVSVVPKTDAIRIIVPVSDRFFHHLTVVIEAMQCGEGRSLGGVTGFALRVRDSMLASICTVIDHCPQRRWDVLLVKLGLVFQAVDCRGDRIRLWEW